MYHSKLAHYAESHRDRTTSHLGCGIAAKIGGANYQGTTCRLDKQKVTWTHQLPRTKSCLWCAASATRLPRLRLGAAIIILKGPGGKLCSKGLHVVLGQQIVIFEAARGHSAAGQLPARGWQAPLKHICGPRISGLLDDQSASWH